MSLTYKIETPPSYLWMIFEGIYHSSAAEVFTDQILETCKNYQPKKLLIDLRNVTGNMSIMDRFNLSVIAARKYFGAILTHKIPSCRYAILGCHPLVDSAKFEETVAVNRGINVRVFTEINGALLWLEKE